MSEPTVSVVIPAYDQAAFIEGCLDSVAEQTWTGSLEVVVVDDGSPDDIGDRAADHLIEPTVIRQKNAGVAAARNRGVAESSGDWIAFLDADDRWTPDKLERQLEAVRALNRPALSFCRYRRHTPDGEPVDVAPDHPAEDLKPTPRKLLRENFIGTSTVVVHSACLERCGGFPEDDRLQSVGQDYALWLRIAAYFPLVYAPFVGMHYTVHRDNRVGVDPVNHHRGGLEALRDFRNWDPDRFRGLSLLPFWAMVGVRTGKFAVDSVVHDHSYPSGSVSRALRASAQLLAER